MGQIVKPRTFREWYPVQFLLILQFLFLAGSITAQNETILKRIIEQEAFKSAQLGIVVRNLTTGEVLMKHNADLRLNPASILKVRTSANAMIELGSDHRFKTGIYILGEIEGNVLFGDILIKGFGDPTFESDLSQSVSMPSIVDDIQNWCSKNAVTCIEGIKGDASWFDLPGVPPGYIQQDVANYYGAGVYGLNIHENYFDIEFNRLGNGLVEVIGFDSIAAQFVTSDVHAEGRSDQAYAYFHPTSGGYHVVGSIPEGYGPFRIKAAMLNPPLYLSSRLKSELEKKGISVRSEPVIKWMPYAADQAVLWKSEYYSPPLETIVKEVLHESNNMFAEALYRQTLRGAEQEKVKNDDYVVDGSGLSPVNRISANSLMEDLDQLASASGFEDFIKLMPLNGHDGTVKYVLSDNPGELYMKSGSMRGVRCYSGFHQTDQGDWVGFVCMANDLTSNSGSSKKAWERLLSWIAEI